MRQAARHGRHLLQAARRLHVTRTAAATVADRMRRLLSAAYDPIRQTMIVFGGNNGSVMLNDTWALTSSLLVDAGTDVTVTSNAIAQATVTLTAAPVVGTPTSYSWSGPGVVNAAGQSITLTLSLGAYTFTVTAVDGSG